jgi:hypothetical protein
MRHSAISFKHASTEGKLIMLSLLYSGRFGMQFRTAFLARRKYARRRTHTMVDPFEYAKEEHDRIHEAVKTFAAAIGCEMSEQGGKKFARIVMVAHGRGRV